MRILFSLRHPGYARNYEPVIRSLAERGHQVHLVFHARRRAGEDEDELVAALARASSNVSVGSGAACRRSDIWRALARLLRGAQDYLRYRAPEFRRANALRARAYGRLWRPVRALLAGWAAVGGSFGCRLLGRWLRAAELALPCDPRISSFLRSLAPDVLLVSPLVDLGSEQKDYVRAAQAAGYPVGLCVASWDNLTNKGLIGPSPDLVMLWNERQRDEAVRLHGVASQRIRITGAQCYDHWFARSPATSSAEFCARVGLDPQRPFVLFVCSSPFIAGTEEVELVRRWIASIRGCDDPRLAAIGILVRPHPQHAAPWREVDLGTFGNVAIYPRAGANPVDEARRADFFDSLYHSVAVVGINTSALIEAAIVGRPVLTPTMPELAGRQDGTLHFRYLVESGLLHTSDSLEGHLGQLRDAVGGRLEMARAADFVRSFVRPLGLDQPATPQVVAAIEELAGAPASLETVRAAALLRRLLLGPAVLLAWIDRRRKSWASEAGTLAGRVLRALLRRAGLLPPPEAALGADGEPSGPSRPREIRLALRRLATAQPPIVVGPWLSEVGFEVLYWVPFLNWACEYGGLDRERLVVVSRGGTGSWYGGLAARYIDVLDFFTVEEFRAANQLRVERAGGQKHRRLTEFDDEILRRVQRTLAVPTLEVLHPSFMYNLFVRFWRGQAGLELIDEHTRFRPFRPPPGADDLGLPTGDYVAVKFYWSQCFPDTLENRALVSRIVRALAARSEVVLLDTGLVIDDHRDSEPPPGQRIHRIAARVSPARNLELQSRVVAGARAFIGTYGGFSYLGPSYGVPSLAIYSDASGFLPVHLRVAERAFDGPPFGALRIAEAAQVGDVSWLWTEDGLRAAVV